jgi:hypothetical protein
MDPASRPTAIKRKLALMTLAVAASVLFLGFLPVYPCPACGNPPRTSLYSCPTCHHTGKLTLSQRLRQNHR